MQRALDSGLTEGRRGRRLIRHAKTQAWAESRLSRYDTFNDYAEMREYRRCTLDAHAS